MSRQQDINQSVLNIIGEENITGNGAVIRVVETCVTEINGIFFLIAVIRVGISFERAIVIRISAALAAALERAGIDICTVRSVVPITTPGREVQLLGAFIVDGIVILIFFVENNVDEIVLVRTPLINTFV